jgi:hypothetical protein
MFLNPQAVGGRPVSPSWYREMLNRAAAAIRAVQPDGVVIAGSLAPFAAYPLRDAVPPMRFMRELLCMSGGRAPKPTCSQRSLFDIWSHHPYTPGGPTTHAAGRDNVTLADLPAMRRLLLGAARAGHVVSRQTPRFWVTEFGWDSNPPDPKAVPERLEARWVAEALYRMWNAGVSLVTWYQLRDDPLGKSFAQTGLYFNDGPAYRLNRPKLALTSFRFPFVAYKRGGRVLVWGRAPDAPGRDVVLEQSSGGKGWRFVAVLPSDASGVFSARLRTRLAGSLRARVPRGRASLPFSLRAPRGMVLPSPFGS